MIKFSESLGCSDKLSRSAWAFLNDRTTLCLTHDNEVVAAAAIFIASKYLDEPLPHSEAHGESWWDHMCVDVEQVQVASHLILDLYASLKQSP
ncbi:hypothetical protein DSO57_1012598 [Entomophthora muscae]|uniref:Uncharacterized protein n=1 Tax=Entomophthora muscae TaxID=34485 RepID=A0ACC2URH0_9FUNG|nr:hypothetical protein DSO57_1012598 [Entomophthora muscae]